MYKVEIIAVLFIFIIMITGCREKITDSPETPITRGSIFINSYPPGARIFVNGIFRNKFTPDSLIGLNPGIYYISLEWGLDISDTTFEVYLQEGKNLSYNITKRNLNH